MVSDVVKDMGALCLGSRFRRIGERLQGDTQRILDAKGIDIQANQFPALAAIDRLGPLSIGDLASALGVTQPGVTRTTSLLIKAGYLKAIKHGGDQRVRLLSLTPKGEHLVEASKRDVWPGIEGAVIDVCGGTADELLALLERLERGLTESPLIERMENEDPAGR